MKQINVRLEDEFLRDVKQFGLDHNMSMTFMVRESLKVYMSSWSGEDKPPVERKVLRMKHTEYRD